MRPRLMKCLQKVEDSPVQFQKPGCVALILRLSCLSRKKRTFPGRLAAQPSPSAQSRMPIPRTEVVRG